MSDYLDYQAWAEERKRNGETVQISVTREQYEDMIEREKLNEPPKAYPNGEELKAKIMRYLGFDENGNKI